MEVVKFIVENLNKPPFNKTFNIISFDSLAQDDLFQILSNILSEIMDQKKIDIHSENFEETTIRIFNTLCILRYTPVMDTSINSFRQNFSSGDKHTIYILLEWLLTNMKVLKRRAYLSYFLIKVEIPSDILGDSNIASLYQQYIQLIEDFKKVHNENMQAEKGNKISISELRSDGVTMEKEKKIVSNRIYHIKKKSDNLPNINIILQICHNLRTEFDRKKEITWQLQEESVNIRQCEQRLMRLSQQLQEMQKRSVGLSSLTLLKKLEEETYVTSYIVDQKLPKELNQQKKEKEVYENIVNSNNVTKVSNDALNIKIQSISQEINKLLENRLISANNSDDKIVLFRQQAAIIARKKDNLAEKFSQLKQQLQEIRSKLTYKQQKLDEVVGETGIILKDNEKFQEYVNKLRTRSSIYKRYRNDLATLKAESGILSRTLDILRIKANKFGADLSNLSLKYEKDSNTNIQDKNSDALLALITQMAANIASQKNKLIPLVNQIKPMKEKIRELLFIHEEKKRIYDRINITLNTNITKLSKDVNSLQEEYLKIIQKINLLDTNIFIAEINLKRAKNEFQISIDKNNSTLLIRDKLTHKIAESDKINKLLKEEHKHIRDNEQNFLLQKNSWSNIYFLLQLKIKCWEQEKEEMNSLLHLESGAETLVLR
ncbi:hypothetical protein PGB90_009747 [Kerria lacca]